MSAKILEQSCGACLVRPDHEEVESFGFHTGTHAPLRSQSPAFQVRSLTGSHWSAGFVPPGSVSECKKGGERTHYSGLSLPVCLHLGAALEGSTGVNSNPCSPDFLLTGGDSFVICSDAVEFDSRWPRDLQLRGTGASSQVICGTGRS